MAYKIVVDSCCEMTDTLKSIKNIVSVPLTLQIDNYKILDDENFEQNDFVERMLAYEGTANPPALRPLPLQTLMKATKKMYMLSLSQKNSAVHTTVLFRQ